MSATLHVSNVASAAGDLSMAPDHPATKSNPDSGRSLRGRPKSAGSVVVAANQRETLVFPSDASVEFGLHKVCKGTASAGTKTSVTVLSLVHLVYHLALVFRLDLPTFVVAFSFCYAP